VKDRGAFSLAFIVLGNLWVISGLDARTVDGASPNYALDIYVRFAVGLLFLFLGVYGVYKTYVAKK
jgi:hypothetical protein